MCSERRLWEHSPDVTYGKRWTEEEVALLGTVPDAEIARRTYNAVQLQRTLRGIPRFQTGPPVGATFEPRTGRVPCGPGLEAICHRPSLCGDLAETCHGAWMGPPLG
jgi:hypothetical protein